MSIVTRNVPAKAKRVSFTKPKSPYWLKVYWKHLSRVLFNIAIISGAILGVAIPVIPIFWLIVCVAGVPPRPVHDGWWIVLIDIILSVFWYTGLYVITKEYESRKRHGGY